MSINRSGMYTSTRDQRLPTRIGKVNHSPNSLRDLQQAGYTVAHVPTGGFGAFDERPDEPREVLEYREKTFVSDWKAQLQIHREKWKDADFTATTLEDEQVHRQIAAQVRHDMFYDVAWNLECPPHDEKMYRRWRTDNWDSVLSEEIGARVDLYIKRNARQSIPGNDSDMRRHASAPSRSRIPSRIPKRKSSHRASTTFAGFLERYDT